MEPEKITILEGPTPDFEPDIQLWNWGLYQTLQPSAVATCRLRTANGEGIRARCKAAWKEGRRVVLDYPDDMRLRCEIDVVALRLEKIEEGTVLHLWVNQLVDELENVAEDGDSADNDDWLAD